MRLSEAILHADELRPNNNIAVSTKNMWVRALEERIFKDIFAKHQNAPEGIGNFDNEDPVLLFSDNDPEVYVWFLLSQIDAALGESQRYNTSVEKFNAVFSEAAARHNREHIPLQPNKIHNKSVYGGIL